MATINTLLDLFVDQLRDRYDAAKQQAAMYPKLADAASHSDLKAIINQDTEANNSHQQKLEEIFAKLSEKPEGERCEGTQGLIQEATDLLDDTNSGKVLDVGIAVSVQHINHHDIAGYNSCILYAKAHGMEGIVGTLNEMLEDEKSTDEALNKLIDQLMNK